jgi:membrane associated rhomboid family serine protease
MFGVTTSDDYQPVTWVGRHPVHVTTLLVAMHTFLMVLACLLYAFNAAGILVWLIFDNAQVLYLGHVWRIATYALVHLPSSPGALLWFAVEMYMLFAFGRELERYFGRRAFIVFYVLLMIVPTLLLTLAGFWMRLGLAGSATIHFGIFLAFAAIYPDVEMFFVRIQMKWVALILVAIGFLAALANHDWASMLVLIATILTAVGFVRMRGAGGDLEWWTTLKSRFQPKPKFHVVTRDVPRRSSDPESVHESIDPVLEKISKHGINSLTASERRALDRARNTLLKKPE